MKAVVTVIGTDRVGILSRISTACAQSNANVIDVTQTVMQEYFCMIMLVDISALSEDFTAFSDRVSASGVELGMKVHVMHEDIFNSMHRI